jgi:1-acyl-sn-glycerol-3-phosphate acyltransferase
MERVERVTLAYRAVMAASTPGVRWWGRLEVSGLEQIPLEGPLLMAGNHDSYWDPVAVGIAGLPRRQIRALAKRSLWKPVIGTVLDGMGQIPIDRGAGDVGAFDEAVRQLRGGACIGIFPEGTRSLGRELRARSGIGRLAELVPEADVLAVAVHGTVDIPRFPLSRPHVRVDFFRPEGGGKQPGETAAEFAARLLAEIRARAPIAVAGRRRG